MTPKSPRRQSDRRLFYFSVALIFSSLFLMGTVTQTMKKAEDDEFYEFSAMFSEVYKQIKDGYVEEVDTKKLLEGALQGMFLTLDPHSQYMDPDNFTQLEKDTEGNFSGVGLHITLKDGVLTAIAPIPGSPAAKAGVRPWDRIIEIDGKKTEGITLLDAVKKLTGPTGTTVRITVWREGEPAPLHFELVRRNIDVPSVYWELRNDDIGYIRIRQFSDNTSRDLRKAIEELEQKGAKGFIVDLRYNSGGLLNEAIDTTGLFVGGNKTIVSTKGRNKEQNHEYKYSGDAITDLPLIVLINKGSASASEIFAGAIKDLKRGIVLGIKGQRSFGKGSVQTIQEIEHSFEKDEDGNPLPSAIRLTKAKYYLPNGETIDKQGVTPDIAIELPKGHELELLRHGLLGDPPTEEDDDSTTKSRFTWEKYNNGQLSTGETTATETPAPESTSSGEPMEDSIVGSAVRDEDKKTTDPEPKRIIALDRSLFPDAEVEGAEPKQEEPKKKKNGKFVDYQLLVAERLMKDKIAGLNFFDPQAGVPKTTETLTASAATDDTQTTELAAATN